MSKFREYVSFANRLSLYFTVYITVVVTLGCFVSFWQAYKDVGLSVLSERLLVIYVVLIPGSYVLFFLIGLYKFHLEYGFKNKTWESDGF
ncbi:hypothetical protein [Ferrimonas futtsuensis]|uniref:hypothetical protein n=1 Tax=Ferrimonas futtsuensis TaxID=364764 RepID=UPI0012FC99F5|nr:hypothetical protein [Ferrimonas futtsuensis]